VSLSDAARHQSSTSGLGAPRSLRSRGGTSTLLGGVPVPREFALRHERAAESHAEAPEFWDDTDDAERAELERRNAGLERDAAELEADRARLKRKRT